MQNELKLIFAENAAKLLGKIDKVIDKMKMYSKKREVNCTEERLISLNER